MEHSLHLHLEQIHLIVTLPQYDQIVDIDSHNKPHSVLDSSVESMLCFALGKAQLLQHCVKL
jgi:hypothetical protein